MAIDAEIRDFIDRHIVLPDTDQTLVLMLWILHTWTFSESLPTPRTTPYLYIHSPEKQSGKTLLLEILEQLVREPLRTASITPSVLFRVIEKVRPTILLDEVDAIWSGSRNEDLRGTVNSGYKFGGYVWRSEGLEPTRFSTFSPKVMAGIDNGLLPDTIRDRCIPIRLKRRAKGDREVEPFYMFEIGDEVERLRDEILAWTREHAVTISQARPKPIPDIGDRGWEIAMPLIAVAQRLGIEAEARAAVSKLILANEVDQLSVQAQLLFDIRELFEQHGSDRLTTNEILAHLGPRWTAKALASKLRPYEIAPTTIRRAGTVAKGFYREDFEDSWRRYLP